MQQFYPKILLDNFSYQKALLLIALDAFSQQNNENSPKLKICPKLRGLIQIALEILPKTEYGKLLC